MRFNPLENQTYTSHTMRFLSMKERFCLAPVCKIWCNTVMDRSTHKGSKVDKLHIGREPTILGVAYEKVPQSVLGLLFPFVDYLCYENDNIPASITLPPLLENLRYIDFHGDVAPAHYAFMKHALRLTKELRIGNHTGFPPGMENESLPRIVALEISPPNRGIVDYLPAMPNLKMVCVKIAHLPEIPSNAPILKISGDLTKWQPLPDQLPSVHTLLVQFYFGNHPLIMDPLLETFVRACPNLNRIFMGNAEYHVESDRFSPITIHLLDDDGFDELCNKLIYEE